MKIVVISDIHGFCPKIDTKSIDGVLICGDICPDFGRMIDYRSLSKQQIWLKFFLQEYIDKLPNCRFIGGNHDFCIDMYGCDHDGYMCNEFSDLNGLHVYGFPYTICPGWAFGKNDEEISQLLLTSEKQIDIMVCHNPPYLIGDKLATDNRNADNHIGSVSIREYIEAHKPRVCIFGHIHEGYGSYMLNDTLCINCSYCDKSRNARQEYLVLDTDTLQVERVTEC